MGLLGITQELPRLMADRRKPKQAGTRSSKHFSWSRIRSGWRHHAIPGGFPLPASSVRQAAMDDRVSGRLDGTLGAMGATAMAARCPVSSPIFPSRGKKQSNMAQQINRWLREHTWSSSDHLDV